MLAPKLRFKDDNGREFPEWKEKVLGEISQKISLKNKKMEVTTVLTNSAVKGVIKQEDFFDREIVSNINLDTYFIISENDFVYNPRISVTAPVGPINRNKLSIGVMSPLYTVFRFNKGNIVFFENFFQSYHWHLYMKSIANYGVRFDRMNITDRDFFNLPIPQPCVEEQAKIANFLTTLDTRINQQEKQCQLLEQYKKGMMQQLFSQKLQFKDDNGEEFPEWESKKLEELGSFFSGGTPLTTEKNFFNGDIPFIKSGEISSSTTEQNITLEGLEHSSAKLVEKGDILYALYGATSGEVAISKISGAINQAVLCIRTSLNNYFLYSYLLYSKSRIIRTYLQGGQGNLSAQIIKQLAISVPDIKEQTKISHFLSILDDKITLAKQQLEQLNTYKKGLLQQLFI